MMYDTLLGVLYYEYMQLCSHISVANNRIILGDILGKRVYLAMASYKKRGNLINIVGQKGKIRTILQEHRGNRATASEHF